MEQNKDYMKGTENTLIRYYYYINRGLDIVNQFRNLFLGFIAVYLGLHLTNIGWILVMFILSLPILTIVGWYNTHKVLKNSEYLATQFSTHFARSQFDLIKEQVEELKKINEQLTRLQK